ncbi:MAG TPA: hypothetical protein VF916_10485 [Ktedonobacterales bacterium]
MRVPHRGRAIVRKLSAQLSAPPYRPGDFLLTRSGGSLARLLGASTGSELNHAALIVDPSGGLIEGAAHGWLGAGAVRRAHVRDYLEADEPCWVGHVEVPDGARQVMVEYTEWLVETRASLSAVSVATLALHTVLCIGPRARSARHRLLRPLHQFFDRHALVVRAEHVYTSGELVARALERGGFVWGVDPSHVTPAELFERFHPHDASAGGAPISLMRVRAARRPQSPQAVATRGSAHVSRFVPRASRSSAAAGEALTLDPQRREIQTTAAPEGVRAIAQVAVLAVGSLALVRGIEILLRWARQE